jgi:hypothetical protein
MKANKLVKFLKQVEKQIKPYGRTLKDVDVNFRRSDDSDIEQTDFVGVDLYDSESNNIIESIVLMGKH